MNVYFSKKAEKSFLKLDKTVQQQIKKFIDKLSTYSNPRLAGKGLIGDLLGLWRYRVGDYRLLCRIYNENLEILVVEIGHRKEIYD